MSACPVCQSTNVKKLKLPAAAGVGEESSLNEADGDQGQESDSRHAGC